MTEVSGGDGLPAGEQRDSEYRTIAMCRDCGIISGDEVSQAPKQGSPPSRRGQPCTGFEYAPSTCALCDEVVLKVWRQK